jgi:RNA polymerase sigma-70 factor (ECF subfamily)
LNALRARKRRRRYEEQAGVLALENSRTNDPAQEVEQALEREQVRRALADLKPRSAEVLILRHAGFSYQEIAAALQVSPGSVGTLLARATREFEASYLALEP